MFEFTTRGFSSTKFPFQSFDTLNELNKVNELGLRVKIIA